MTDNRTYVAGVQSLRDSDNYMKVPTGCCYTIITGATEHYISQALK